MFAFLIFLSALLIEVIGSYVSIIGLSALFSTNPVIIALAVSLDIAKIATVSFLYKQWKNINALMKTYMTLAAIILMVITSSGAAGYLSAEFQKAIIPSKESEILIVNMTDEKARLEARKKEIDQQISQLPPNFVKGRQKLMDQFSGELTHINNRIVEIDQKLPELQIKQVDVNAHAGPILYVAQAFDTTVEAAVKYVILLIIFVFDPLAIALIIAGNFLLDQRKAEKLLVVEQPKPIDPPPAPKPVIEERKEVVEENPKEEPVTMIEDFISLSPDDPILKGSEVETLPPQLDEEIHLTPELHTEELKRKRGRKKKEESEPKPSIATDEQLAEILQKQEDDVIEVEKIEASILGLVNHNNADVRFHDTASEDSSWKPSKKVMNKYTL